MPGGGGTPLAAGLRPALELALLAQGKGMTPSVALLTDGRANVDLSGTANRAQAADDATAMARAIRARGWPGIVIDTGVRPTASLGALARDMGVPYLLPAARRCACPVCGDRRVADPRMKGDLPPDDWPGRSVSRIVQSKPHRWHVQVTGKGPDVLLLHGAGASSHSWASLIGHLDTSHRVIALDLPGHGWTRSPRGKRAAE